MTAGFVANTLQFTKILAPTGKLLRNRLGMYECCAFSNHSKFSVGGEEVNSLPFRDRLEQIHT
jgi:hypothetical protein